MSEPSRPGAFEIRYGEAEIAGATRAIARHWLRTWVTRPLVGGWIILAIGVAFIVYSGVGGLVLHAMVGLLVLSTLYWPFAYGMRLLWLPPLLRKVLQPSATFDLDTLELRMTANGRSSATPWSRLREIREVPGYFLLCTGRSLAIPLPTDQVPPDAQALMRSLQVVPPREPGSMP